MPLNVFFSTSCSQVLVGREVLQHRVLEPCTWFSGTSSRKPLVPAKIEMHWSIGIGLILGLLEQLDQAGAAVELLLRGLVELGAELGEGFELAIGGQVEPQRAGDLLHRLGLGVAADAADTLMPTLIAGRTPAKNRSGSR